MFHNVSKLDFTFQQHLSVKPIIDYFPLQFNYCFRDCVQFKNNVYFRNVSSHHSGNTMYLQAWMNVVLKYCNKEMYYWLLIILIIDGPLYHTIGFECCFYTASSTIYFFPRIFVDGVCAVATTIHFNFRTFITIQCWDWIITGKNCKDAQM